MIRYQMSQSQDQTEPSPSTNPTVTTNLSRKNHINNITPKSTQLQTPTDPENDDTPFGSMLDLNFAFCEEVQECDEINEYEKNKKNKNENVSSSSDSGFCSSDAEESVSDDDDDSTCPLDELSVEEV